MEVHWWLQEDGEMKEITTEEANQVVEEWSMLDLVFGALAAEPGSGIEKLPDGSYKVEKGWI